jgi:hypothetical protein
MISTSFLNTNAFLKISNICSTITNASSTYVFTFSKYTPWPIEYIPPSVTPNITNPVELFGYLKVASASPVIQITSSTTSDFSFNGLFYKKLAPTFSDISSYNCFNICFESILVHSQLPQSSWRGLGLAISPTPVTSNTILSSNLSSLSHLYLQHSGPKTKELNVSETLRLLLPITNLL